MNRKCFREIAIHPRAQVSVALLRNEIEVISYQGLLSLNSLSPTLSNTRGIRKPPSLPPPHPPSIETNSRLFIWGSVVPGRRVNPPPSPLPSEPSYAERLCRPSQNLAHLVQKTGESCFKTSNMAAFSKIRTRKTIFWTNLPTTSAATLFCLIVAFAPVPYMPTCPW